MLESTTATVVVIGSLVDLECNRPYYCLLHTRDIQGRMILDEILLRKDESIEESDAEHLRKEARKWHTITWTS